MPGRRFHRIIGGIVHDDRGLGHAEIPSLPANRAEALGHVCMVRYARKLQWPILDVHYVEPDLIRTDMFPHPFPYDSLFDCKLAIEYRHARLL